MEFKDYYAILGVDKQADQDQIKRAYRKLAREFHPDVNKGADAEHRFKEICEAYEALKDPEKRAAYDRIGSRWSEDVGFKPPPGWEQDFAFAGGGFTEADPADYSEFFRTIFGDPGFRSGRSYGRRFQQRGEDHLARVQIDVSDAYHGNARQFTIDGFERLDDGALVPKRRTLSVKIPQGIRRGQKIRLAGQGGAGRDAEDGDLLLEVDFAPHPLYRVEGGDIHLTLPVAPWEAALGGKITVPTPEGKVSLSVPPDSQDGQVLRLAGRGLPGSKRGDMLVTLAVRLPAAQTDAVRAAYQQLHQASAFDPRAHWGAEP